MQEMQRLIGITGGIASGKSKLLAYLKDQGFDTISLDDLVHQGYMIGGFLYEVVNEEFKVGNGFEIDRKKLKEIVYNDDLKLKKLNDLTHPLILNKLDEIVSTMSKLVFVEAPILYGSCFERYFDIVIAVLVSEEVQIERLKKRNGLDYEDSKKIIDLQVKSDYLKKHATYTVNMTDENTMEKDILKILGEIND